MCLEVAEHIPEGKADNLVKLITSSAPLALFSAAIPGQGGVRHVNEQYPSYWIAKFSSFEFECYDMIRPRFWNNAKVSLWYRQNMLIFKKKGEEIRGIDHTKKVDLAAGKNMVDIVHPDLFADKLQKPRFLLRKENRPDET